MQNDSILTLQGQTACYVDGLIAATPATKFNSHPSEIAHRCSALGVKLEFLNY